MDARTTAIVSFAPQRAGRLDRVFPGEVVYNQFRAASLAGHFGANVP